MKKVSEISERRKPHKIVVGERFNRLVAMKLSYIGTHYRAYWLFKCDCGKEKVIMGALVVCGNTKSCGCLVKEVRASTRISHNHSEITAIILGYKRHALDRGFKWELSRQFVEGLVAQKCHYCGAPPSNIKRTKNSLGAGLLYSGIDRVDSTQNYTEDNVVPCCKICNYAKSNLSLEEFRDWAIKLGKRAMSSQWS